MRRDISISLFLPAYNEEENIERVVANALEGLEAAVETYEVIVVNDGSQDSTGTLAEGLAAGNDRVRVIHHAENAGYGGALKSGIRAAQHDYVAFIDADGQFDATELRRLAAHVPRYKAVVGYRADRRDSLIRKANAALWNLLMRAVFGIKVRDIDCAFKLFERTALQRMELRSEGAMISAEILARLSRMGITPKEVPVAHFPRAAGESSGGDIAVIAKAFREMAELYWSGLGNVTGRQALKFAAVGVINTAVDIVSYALLSRFVPGFSGRIILSKTFSFFLGTLSSLFLNRTWTFRVEHELTGSEVARFYAAVAVGMALNVSAMHVLANVLGMNDIAAAAVSTGATFAWNFIASKLWVFAPKELPDEYRRIFRMIVRP